MAESRLIGARDAAGNYGPALFADDTGVSRETLEKFESYYALLRSWQPTKNLVGPATLDDIWHRHFWDSAQIVRLIPSLDSPIADLGSGAGFPGMVLALLGYDRVTLYESNGRKCAFLEHVRRETGAHVTIRNMRVEEVRTPSAVCVVSRACAPLSKLLGYAARVMVPSGRAIFHKGLKADQEIAAARKLWKLSVKTHPSWSSDAGVLLEIKRLRRVKPQ